MNPNFTEVNAAAQVADPASVFAHYLRLISLRHTEPLVTDGRYELLLPEHPALFAFTRTESGRGLLVLANFSGSPLDIPAVDGWAGAALVLGNYPDRAEVPGERLRPWAALVLRR